MVFERNYKKMLVLFCLCFTKSALLAASKEDIQRQRVQDYARYLKKQGVQPPAMPERHRVFYEKKQEREALNKQLFTAIEAGDIALVESLLNRGANPNVRDKEEMGATPLLMASGKKENALAMVRLLLKNGADLSKTQDDEGFTPLMMAVQVGNQDLVSFLLSQGESAHLLAQEYGGQNALHQVGRGGESIADILLKADIPIDSKDSMGNTILMKAARLGYTDLVRFLLSQGADKNLKNNNGETALMLAAGSQEKDTVLFLLSQEASPEDVSDALALVTNKLNEPISKRYMKSEELKQEALENKERFREIIVILERASAGN